MLRLLWPRACDARRGRKLDRLLERRANCRSEALELGAGNRLSDANDAALSQLGVVNAESVRADDLFLQQRGVEQFYRARELERELIERGTGKRELDAGNLQQLCLREASFRKVLVRLFANAFLANQAQVNRRRKSVECFVGADVG